MNHNIISINDRWPEVGDQVLCALTPFIHKHDANKRAPYKWDIGHFTHHIQGWSLAEIQGKTGVRTKEERTNPYPSFGFFNGTSENAECEVDYWTPLPTFHDQIEGKGWLKHDRVWPASSANTLCMAKTCTGLHYKWPEIMSHQILSFYKDQIWDPAFPEPSTWKPYYWMPLPIIMPMGENEYGYFPYDYKHHG
jgi:hypothetical protein